MLDSFTVDPDNGPEGMFEDVEFSFSSGETHSAMGQPLEIVLRKHATGYYLDVDNVRLDATPIPEPTGCVLGFMGLVSLGLVIRRRRQQV